LGLISRGCIVFLQAIIAGCSTTGTRKPNEYAKDDPPNRA
jgi:hypothetical protein